jgi:hypothetical protein
MSARSSLGSAHSSRPRVPAPSWRHARCRRLAQREPGVRVRGGCGVECSRRVDQPRAKRCAAATPAAGPPCEPVVQCRGVLSRARSEPKHDSVSPRARQQAGDLERVEAGSHTARRPAAGSQPEVFDGGPEHHACLVACTVVFAAVDRRPERPLRTAGAGAGAGAGTCSRRNRPRASRGTATGLDPRGPRPKSRGVLGPTPRDPTPGAKARWYGGGIPERRVLKRLNVRRDGLLRSGGTRDRSPSKRQANGVCQCNEPRY